VWLTRVQVYVQEGIYDKFLAALKKKAETVAIGQVSDVPFPTSSASIHRFIAAARFQPHTDA
jgi:acyl-CoA reductase-like NAD-dependent aldehyde dehydrogenase